MGRTTIEKIFSLRSRDAVAPGSIIWLDLDVRSARDFGGANVVKNFRARYGDAAVADPGKTVFTFDCNVPANTIPYANNQMACRLFAEQQGMKVFDVDAGIGSHVTIDHRLAGPGDTVVGTDSHLNILGAAGIFGQGMGDVDIAFAFKTGKTWFEVPRSMRVVLTGRLRPPATAKDAVLTLLGMLGSDGALDHAVDFTGEGASALTLDERITVSSMVTEMAGIIGFFPVDGETAAFYAGRDLPDIAPDPDARYERTVTLDLSTVVPSVARPGSPSDVVSVGEAAGRKVHSVFIGSCTNGRLSDLRLAAAILKGKKVAPGVMLKVVPSTRGAWRKLIESGDLQTLFEAGAIVSQAGCGGCASGQLGMTGKGEVQVSTSNRNFKGKQGDGDTYLASPATAAYAALAGKIVEPEA